VDILLGLAISAHIGFVGEYNSIHPNVRAEFDNTLVVGAYYNSEENISLYLAKYFENAKGYFMEVGVVSGYDIQDAPIIPFFRAGKEINENCAVFVAPAVEVVNGETNIAVVVGVEYKNKVRGRHSG
jgi:hypothetical protein